MELAAELGLALSGGGSRAAAFHRGTLQGLFKVGILKEETITKEKLVVSTVSGGSVFGAAWMKSIVDGKGAAEFLENMKKELMKGFIRRSIRPRLLKAILPGYTRTNVLAKTFDKIFFEGMQLKALPDQPKLCINTTLLNNGQVGKFSKEGFRASGLTPLGGPFATLNFPLYLAVAASAAFPIGMPPILLKRGQEIPEDWGQSSALRGHKRFALTDGGVLENLGIQTLLRSWNFQTWDIILSDAGRRLEPWRPGTVKEKLLGLLMGFVSAPTLKRVNILMNDKENRHMRLQLFLEMEKTWLVDGVQNSDVGSAKGIENYLSDQCQKPRRRLLFLRVAQTWNRFFTNVTQWRLVELGELFRERTGKEPPPIPPRPYFKAPKAEREEYPKRVVEYLEKVLPPSMLEYLKEAKKVYSEMGGDQQALALNDISTGFTALSGEEIDALHHHSYWQVLAAYALFW